MSILAASIVFIWIRNHHHRCCDCISRKTKMPNADFADTHQIELPCSVAEMIVLVLDIETTGLSKTNDTITVIGTIPLIEGLCSSILFQFEFWVSRSHFWLYSKIC